MHLGRASILTFWVAQAATLGCNPLVKIDVDCQKLCVTEPGPAIPGLLSLGALVIDAAGTSRELSAIDAAISGLDGSALAMDSSSLVGIDGSFVGIDGSFVGIDGSFVGIDGENGLSQDAGVSLNFVDAGLPSSSLEWHVEMKFNEVLKEIPSVAANMSANVQLTSVNLTSTADLSFIHSMDVFLSHGKAEADGGMGTLAEGNAAGTADGGVSPACAVAGASLYVAYFRNPETGASGSSLSMIAVDPTLNLFDCMKNEPTRFDIKMTVHPDTYPTSDTPLSLGTCVGVQTHITYP